tara:strand:- start:1428 stop:2447 length:1020 start_codon:yes stop_codon:yes gene_type:complete
MPERHDTDFNWPDFVEKINSELIAAYGNFVHRVLTLGGRLESGTNGPFNNLENKEQNSKHYEKLEGIHESITNSLKTHRYKEALRFVMNAAQYGNQMLQNAEPWKYMKSIESKERTESLSELSFGWRIARFIAITSQPFMPTSAQTLWEMLGESGNVADVLWHSAIDWNVSLKWNDEPPKPLFERLDLERIIDDEKSLIVENNIAGDKDEIHSVKGGKKVEKMKEEIEGIANVDFETFMKIELRVGKIKSVEEHPNADKLMVISLDDGTERGRTICAGLKEYYSAEEMSGMHVVFVSNLEPRKLRGVMSEGMLLAADDESGNVKLITVDNSMSTGSRVR